MDLSEQRTRSASTSEHSTISAVILLYLPASALQNIIISYPAYFLRSLIIQLHIEFFLIVNYLLIPDIYVYFRALYRLRLLQYIATDFYHNA